MLFKNQLKGNKQKQNNVELPFLCIARRVTVINMHIKFRVIWTNNDKLRSGQENVRKSIKGVKN